MFSAMAFIAFGFVAGVAFTVLFGVRVVVAFTGAESYVSKLITGFEQRVTAQVADVKDVATKAIAKL